MTRAAPSGAPRLPGRGERPFVSQRLNSWWVLAAGTAVALAFVATDHMWRATGTLAATLVVAAVLRAVLPAESAGGLVVRRTLVDVTLLLLLAVAVALSGFTLDLTALP